MAVISHPSLDCSKRKASFLGTEAANESCGHGVDERAEVGVTPQGASHWPPSVHQWDLMGGKGFYIWGGVYFYCIYFVEVSYFPASSYSKLLVRLKDC